MSSRRSTSAISPLTDHVLAERIFNALKQAIFSLELSPGEPLVERELSERFGVSKSPVRDALQRLAGEGLVTQTAYRGTVVRRIEAVEADEIYAMREVLEEWAVQLATPRLTEDDLDKIQDILSRARRTIGRLDGAIDRAKLAHINRRFHGAFAEKSGNSLLASTLLKLQDRVRIISVLGWQSRPSMEEEFRQHEAVLSAAVARDSQRAAELMRKHIHAFRANLRMTQLTRR